MSQEEIPRDLPIHETLKPLAYREIFKTGRWWGAVVMVNRFGREEISLYLWQNREGKWKRQQKFTIRRKTQWEKIKKAVDELIGQIS